MHQQAGPFNVPQKTNSQTVALVRAFDQAGNVGHHEGALVLHANDAQVRLQRRERVAGHLWARC